MNRRSSYGSEAKRDGARPQGLPGGTDRDPEGSPRPAAYRHKDDHSYARTEYISAIRRVHPVVLENLHETVLPSFREAIRDLKTQLAPGEHWSGPPEEEDRVLEVLRSPFDAWCGRYYFRGWKEETDGGRRLANWLGSVVLSTLWEWSKGRKLQPLDWDVPDTVVVGAYLHSAAPLEVVVDGWRTLTETVEDFRKRAHSAFEHRLSQYIGHTHATQPEEHVRLRRPVVARHFDWLARHQIKEASYADISLGLPRGDDADPRAVGQGVRSAAEALVGSDFKKWLRPPAKGGRPRGSRNAH